MRRLTLSPLLLAAALSVSAQMSDSAAEAALVTKLLTAPTQVQRLALLNDEDFVFNFGAGVGVSEGAGGSIITANAADFPAVIGNGMAMAVGIMSKPCGMNAPHMHPRAAEFLYLINGTALEVGFIEENGARFVGNTIYPGEGTIFPKGSVHFQANLGCDSLKFVVGFNNVDPGVLSAAQRYFGLPPDVVAASLGDVGIEEVVDLAQEIPDSMALGIQKCLSTCGISRGYQPMKQQQPRVSGNAFPPASSTTSHSSASSNTAMKRSIPEYHSMPPEELLLSNAKLDTLVFILQVVLGMMLSGYAVLGINYIICRRRLTAAIELPTNQVSTDIPMKV